MIGYYVHHVGKGHLHRAMSIAAALRVPVTGLSTVPKPANWAGDWVQLARDDEADEVRGIDANGRLHWVPQHDPGLADRMSAISQWIRMARPQLIVVDVSVEVALLARLHGIPVITVALPGERSDAAHTLGYDVSSVILAAWPVEARGMITGLSHENREKLRPVGAISRYFEDTDVTALAANRRSVVVLSGAGGSDLTADAIAEAQDATPDWTWLALGREYGTWVDYPWPHLLAADVVITHAGQNAIAEVASARRPAIVIPQRRPHAEQFTTGESLAHGWPAIVLDRFPESGWADLLEQASALDGSRWSRWSDGGGARRAAAVIEHELRESGILQAMRVA